MSEFSRAKQLRKDAGITACPKCGAMMEKRIGRENIAFYQCVASENHKEPFTP